MEEMKVTKTIEEIEQENCDMIFPSKWNIYKWMREGDHDKTTIAAAVKRLEKVFDLSESVQVGTSGGKDSTVSGNLACLELNLRHLRVKYGVMRDGTPGIDPLDAKWVGKRIHSSSTNAEVVFTDTNDYIRRFLKKYGPEKWYNLGGTEYKYNDVVKLSDGTKDYAENVFNRVMLGEEIEIPDPEPSK